MSRSRTSARPASHGPSVSVIRRSISGDPRGKVAVAGCLAPLLVLTSAQPLMLLPSRAPATSHADPADCCLCPVHGESRLDGPCDLAAFDRAVLRREPRPT